MEDLPLMSESMMEPRKILKISEEMMEPRKILKISEEMMEPRKIIKINCDTTEPHKVIKANNEISGAAQGNGQQRNSGLLEGQVIELLQGQIRLQEQVIELLQDQKNIMHDQNQPAANDIATLPFRVAPIFHGVCALIMIVNAIVVSAIALCFNFKEDLSNPRLYVALLYDFVVLLVLLLILFSYTLLRRRDVIYLIQKV